MPTSAGSGTKCVTRAIRLHTKLYGKSGDQEEEEEEVEEEDNQTHCVAVFPILRVRVELAKELEHALFECEQLSCCSQCLSPLLPGLLLTSLSEPCVETANYLPVCLSPEWSLLLTCPSEPFSGQPVAYLSF